MTEDQLRVAALQGVLQAAKAYKIRVDGIVGPATLRAIANQPKVAQRAADVIGGDVLQELIASATVEEQQVIQIIKAAAEEFGADPYFFAAKAKIESGFVPTAVNGQYKGLFQMSSAAWADASSVVDSMEYPPLGSYELNWSDARQNSRAAVAYQMAIAQQVRALGWRAPLSAADSYIAHQQGAAGLVRLKKAAAGMQLSPKEAGAMLNAMRRNAPQDGQGITVDPNEFLTRWSAVVAERYADAVA